MHPLHSTIQILAITLLETTAVHAVEQDAWWRVDTSAPSGACYITVRNNQSCITDGAGNHQNDESCTFTIMQDAIVQATQFEVEDDRDYVTINGTHNKFRGGDPGNPPLNVAMKQNEKLTWHADSTANYGGFTICAYSAPAPHMPPPPPPVPAPPPSPSQPPYPPGMAPPVYYMLQSSGQCERPIGSVADCSLAAQALDLADKYADDDFQGVGHYMNAFDPPNCYQERDTDGVWTLKYNNGANSGPCTAKDNCLCFGAAPPSSPPAPPSPPPPSFPPAPPGALLNIVSGSNFCELITMTDGAFAGAQCLTDGVGTNYGPNEACKVYATTNIVVTATEYVVEQCTFGCDYLTLGGTKYQHNNAPNAVHLDAGAIIEWTSDNAGQVAGFTLCAKLPANPAAPPPSPSPPPPPPYAPNQAPAAAFHLREYGACETSQIIDTIDWCNAAAQALSLTDTTASSDPPSSTDPPWCYFEKGELKFNAGGTNTGGCSITDKCICTGQQSPAPPPPPPPPLPPLTSAFTIKSGGVYCQLTSSPPRFTSELDCITDGPGYHGNNEACEIEIERDIRLVSVEFAVEGGGYDYLEIKGTKYTDTTFDTLLLRVGDIIKWKTDLSNTSPGFTVCAENLPPPSPPPTPPPSPPPPSPAAPGGTSLPAVTLVTTVDVPDGTTFNSAAYAAGLATLVGVPASDVTVTVSSRRHLEQQQGRRLAAVTVTAQIITPDNTKATSVIALLNGKSPAQLSADLGVTVTSITPAARVAVVVFPPPSPTPSAPPTPSTPSLVDGKDAQSSSTASGSAGIVAGAVVGGLAFLAIIGVVIFQLCKRGMRQSTTKIVETVPKAKLVSEASDPVDGEEGSVTTRSATSSYPDEYAADSIELDDIESNIKSEP